MDGHTHWWLWAIILLQGGVTLYLTYTLHKVLDYVKDRRSAANIAWRSYDEQCAQLNNQMYKRGEE